MAGGQGALLCLLVAILQTCRVLGGLTTYRSTTTYAASATCSGSFTKAEVYAYTQGCLPTAGTALAPVYTLPSDASLWIDAQTLSSMTISATGGLVSQWTSLRGALSFTSAYSNGLPAYCASCFATNQPGVNFAAASGGLATPAFALPATGDATVIFVGTMGAAVQQWAGLFEHGDSDNDISLEQNSISAGTMFMHFQTANDNSGNQVSFSYDTPYIYIATVTGGVTRTLLQVSATGVEQSSTGTNSLTMAKGVAKPIYLMTSDRTDGQLGKGIVAEVMYYQRVLSAADITAVKNYLKAKWFGLSVPGYLTGSVTTAVALTQVASSSSYNATFTRQIFADSACATLATTAGALTVTNDAGLNAQYRKCTPSASGGGSVAVSYSTTRPRLPDSQGVMWSGFATTDACLAGQAPLWYNFTQAGACVATGTRSAIYTCDRQNLYTSSFTDAACKTSAGTQLSATFAAVKAAACATANPGRADNSNQFVRASCRGFGTLPANTMQVYVPPPVQNTGSWVTRVYHLGKSCKSEPLFYKVDSVVLNKCLPPDNTHATNNYNFVCKHGKSKYTITKYAYAPLDAQCRAAPVEQTVWAHDHACKEDDISPGVYVATVCGAFPFLTSPTDHMLFREFSDAQCLYDGVSRGVIMGVCEPVYGPSSRGGSTPVLDHRRKLVYVWTDALRAGPTVSVAEQRYAPEDSECAGSFTSSTAVYVDGRCQADPLFPGRFVSRVVHVNAGGINVLTTPTWFATFPAPSAAPTPAPTKPTASPTPQPTPTSQPTQRSTNVATVSMWGGGGAGAGGGSGGGGGAASGSITLTPGSFYTVVVGGGGLYRPADPGPPVAGGGGLAGSVGVGGQGGGYTGIFTGMPSQLRALIIAGGGGGSGAVGGGGGGGRIAEAGSGTNAGTGGSQVAGGLGGNSQKGVSDGSALQGGTPSTFGDGGGAGGGGGGFFGGGGGYNGDNPTGNSGGGGGSSFLNVTGTLLGATGANPGDVSNPLRSAATANYGAGGAANSDGKQGVLVLQYPSNLPTLWAPAISGTQPSYALVNGMHVYTFTGPASFAAPSNSIATTAAPVVGSASGVALPTVSYVRDSQNGKSYWNVAFLQSGTMTLGGPSMSGSGVYFLAVGGGGMGSTGNGGGGGAGGFLQGPLYPSLSASETITVTIGAGGTACGSTGGSTTITSSSSGISITAYGGGAGACGTQGPGITGASSGGNSRDSRSNLAPAAVTPPSDQQLGGGQKLSLPVQGYTGGVSLNLIGSWTGSGGGGGAGGQGLGGNGGNNCIETAGNGGPGRRYTLSGMSDTWKGYYWAGGGGGLAETAGCTNGGYGGVGGGGVQCTVGYQGTVGYGPNQYELNKGQRTTAGANTGGGGGACNGVFNGGNYGAAGIVVIAVEELIMPTASPTLTPTYLPNSPTPSPTQYPSARPTVNPTLAPTLGPVTRGLVLALDAASYSGTGNWVDSKRGLSFSLYGGPTYSRSFGGGSISFDPSKNQYAEVGVGLPFMAAWSLEVWLYHTGTVGLPQIITGTGTGGANYWMGTKDDANLLRIGSYNGAQSTYTTLLRDGPNKWYHIVGTFSGSTTQAILYVNNVVQYTSGINGPTSGGDPGVRLMRRWDGDGWWGGALAKANIYAVVLSPDEVNNNFNADRARFGL